MHPRMFHINMVVSKLFSIHFIPMYFLRFGGECHFCHFQKQFLSAGVQGKGFQLKSQEMFYSLIKAVYFQSGVY